MSDTLSNTPKEEKIAEVTNSPVRSVEWNDDKEYELQISLPHGCTYSGGITTQEGQKVFNGGTIRVNPELRGNNIGERLVKTTLARAKQLGATRFETAVESQYALDIFVSVFGDGITISSYDSPDHRADTLPYVRTDLPVITIEQVRASLERLEAYEEDPEYREKGFFLEADLSAVDATDWELPVVELPAS